MGDSTRTKAMMTNRFVKVSTGSERLEIRRYEDADEGINPDRIQEYYAGKADQAAAWSRIVP